MKKRFLAVFLALVLCTGLAVPAFAKELKDADRQDFLNTFTIFRNGSADEKEGGYRVSAPFKLLEIGSYSIEKEGYSVISKDDAWTITNTGSEELSASGNSGYDLLIRLYTYHPEGGADDAYVYHGSYVWHNENGFSSDAGGVLLKAGESVTIPASALMEADGQGSDPGSIYELYIDVRYQGVFDDWQYYKRYYSDIQHLQRSCSFYFRVDEAQKELIDSAGAAKTAFSDVPAGEWYADAVDWAVETEITNGTNDGSNGQPKTFSPNQTCTQAHILTFLYRAARGKVPAAAEDMDKAAAWAKEKGMIDGDFDGGTPCTRATAMRYIWQAFGSPETDPADFTDVDAGADYAAAVAWAVEKGVTNGTNDGSNGRPKTFSPDDICTRGHIVTFLYRAYAE